MTAIECNVCGEFKYTHHHKCPPQWRAWTEDEDPGSDFEDTRRVYAADAEEAAKKFAELECGSDPDYYDSYIHGPRVVFVRLVGGDETIVLSVRGEATVEFHATEAEQKQDGSC